MSRILIGLEMGGNYGHLAVCLPIAHALRARGHAVAFALRDLRLAAEWLVPAGLSFVQSPTPLRTGRLSRPPLNYAEILLSEGYGDVDVLTGLAGAWCSTLRLAQPDLVVAHFAPTALFAAQLSGIPHLAVGPCFTIPPSESPLPSIRPWDDVPQDRLAHADRALDERLDRAAAQLGRSCHSGLRGLFGTNDLLTTFAELDCYTQRSGGRYIGPIYGLPDTSSVAWPSSAGPRILAYLRTDLPGLAELLAALAGCAAQVLCVIPGAKPELTSQFTGTNLKVVPHPVRLQDLLAQAALVVSYGGHGFLCEALQAGRPLLIAPHFVEQALNARGIERLGAGITIGTDRRQEVFDSALTQMLGDPEFTKRAREFSERHAGHTPGQSVALAVEAIEAALHDKHFTRDTHIS